MNLFRRFARDRPTPLHRAVYPSAMNAILVTEARYCEDCETVFPPSVLCPTCGTERHVALRMLFNRESYGVSSRTRSNTDQGRWTDGTGAIYCPDWQEAQEVPSSRHSRD